MTLFYCSYKKSECAYLSKHEASSKEQYYIKSCKTLLYSHKATICKNLKNAYPLCRDFPFSCFRLNSEDK